MENNPIDSRPDKLRQLILLISRASEGDSPFGSVKLNKILFFSDLTAYRRWGRTISGEEYQKLEHGPSPKRMKPLLDDMS